MQFWQDFQETMLKTLLGYKRLGLITDVDGTISPIVDRPDDAYVTARNIELLTALCEILPLVAAVSGRSAGDIHGRVGVPQMEYIGNHGLERWQDGEAVIMPTVAEFRPDIEAAKAAVEQQAPEGVWVEDKQATLSIHYRQAVKAESFADAFRPTMEKIAAEHGVRLFEGRMIFELRPPVEANKGTALQTLIDEYELEAAVFLGDDVTDVDAMHVGAALREAGRCYVLSVGVSADETPLAVTEAADMFAESISGVESFLEWMLRARRESVT